MTALAGLPGMGPRRLLAIHLLHEPAVAWHRIVAGEGDRLDGLAGRRGRVTDDVARAWRRAAAVVDVSALWAAHARAGVHVARLGEGGYPSALAHDLEPPAVVFRLGPLAMLEGPRVAVVGTRRCSRLGAELAQRLGRELSEAGVHVVSGLALGIDAAAHRGALGAGASAAGPIGVVASGLDVAYPARNRRLWDAVVEQGALLSESPLGQRPDAWRFPARNRIIAALAEAVVVVESGDRGGSMYTVDEALARDRAVLAVPGPVGPAVAEGTNRLLVEGATPVRDAVDVLCALGRPVPARTRSGHATGPPALDARGRAIVAALDHGPRTLDDLVDHTGLTLGAVALAVEVLVAEGWLARRGAHLERAAGPEVGRP
ncbi:MAG: DNA-protecting protein DprA [Actinobacteria bacterium]|nr:DNA-protecting protein DprA [Actinomycetota bacterium]